MHSVLANIKTINHIGEFVQDAALYGLLELGRAKVIPKPKVAIEASLCDVLCT